MKNWRSEFLLRDDITFLNFGSFGACPQPVFEKYQQFQLELEREPVEFMTQKSIQYLEDARKALGLYLNCDYNDVVCVMNPSYGVNIVAKSLNLRPGDEILSTNIEYGACDRTWDFVCDKSGAVYKKQNIHFPVSSKDEVIQTVLSGITARTRLLFISHITSSTGMRLPVEEICRGAKERGVLTFIDGAHAPAQVPVDLENMSADFYVGACHKWMMAPKGTSFLYAHKDAQKVLDPLIVSWGYGNQKFEVSRFIDYHEVQGTRDLSAFCTIPFVVDYLERNNWSAVSADCKKMVHKNALRFCALAEQPPLCPVNDDFIAQMYSFRVSTSDPIALHSEMYNKYRIQIPVPQLGQQSFIRYSINAFNTQDDLDRLYDVLLLLKEENKI